MSVICENYLFGEISGLKQSEIDIHRAINRHISLVYAKKWEILDQITEWRKTNIAEIEDYVEQQKAIVEQEYVNKIGNLNSMRNQMLKQVMNFDEETNAKQIKQLVNQCEHLKDELVQIKYAVHLQSRIKVIGDETIFKQEQYDSVDEEIENEMPENITPIHISNEQDIENEMPENITPIRIPIERFASNEIQETKCSNSISRRVPTISIDNELGVVDDQNENSMTETILDKCPLCLMIFSADMNINQRGIHVNEHYTD